MKLKFRYGTTFIVLFTLSIGSLGKSIQESEKICTTTACIHTASDLLHHVDLSIDPCENFYQFSCGKFLNSTVIPYDKNEVNSVTELKEQIENEFAALLMEPTYPTESKLSSLPKKFYQSCMRVKDLNEKEGQTPLLNILDSAGGWPALEGDKWNETKFQWETSLLKLRKMGFYNDFFMHIIIKQTNSNATIELTAPYFDDDTMVQSDTENSYYQKMVAIATILGVSKEQAEKEYMETYNFEQQLISISEREKNYLPSNDIYEEFTINYLNENSLFTQWKDFIENLLPSTMKLDNKKKIIMDVSYFRKFEKLINETPKRVQANFLMWRTIKFSLIYLDLQFRDNKFHYNVPKFESCLGTTEYYFHPSLSYMYIQKYFNESSRNNIQAISDNIKHQFESDITMATWLDKESKEHIVNHLKNMTILIASYNADNKLIENAFEDLQFNDENFLQNILTVLKFSHENTEPWIKKILEFSWQNTYEILIGKILYNHYKNMIAIPAATLRKPFYDNDAPQYLNYGAIGRWIGSEMVRSFYPFARFKNRVVQSTSAVNEFKKKAKCLMESSYNNTVQKTYRLQKNRILDFGGIQAAYLSYNSWLEANGPEPQLPNLPYTNKQMFWISATRNYCSKKRSTPIEEIGEFSFPYIPPEGQIMAMLSNSPAFANDFHCSKHSRMNPTEKCSLW